MRSYSKARGLKSCKIVKVNSLKKNLAKLESSQNLPIDIELQKVQIRAKRFYEVGPFTWARPHQRRNPR